MAAPFDNIVQHLFHQPSLHSVTVDELQHMTQQHPYFAAAHFLLLKKMQDAEHPSFTEQLQRTTLYFNNPLWLQFLLQPEATSHFTVSDKAPFIETMPSGQTEPDADSTRADDAVHDEISNDASERTVSVPDHGETAFAEPAIEEEAALRTETSQGNMMDIISAAFSEPDEVREAEIASVPANLESEEPEREDFVEEAAVAENEPADYAAEHIAKPVEEIKQPEFNPDEEKPVAAIHAAGDQVMDSAVSMMTNNEQSLPSNDQENIQPDAVTYTEPTQEFIEENQRAAEETPAPVIASEPAIEEPESNEQNISAGIEKPLLRTIIETPEANNDLLFEPYHTVDYFASQGIKLGKQENDPKDKLGRQLKSFTDWLKTMKKLPQVSIDKILAENEESKVVEDANHSIENKEVITEAMAEVFEKQGMHDKAAEIYQKLSLLNPSKSAYFAARKEALKHS